jgi:predicted nucleic acid binding AN1-type Zn finger protein
MMIADKVKNFILEAALFIFAFYCVLGAINLLDREPVKERQQYVVIKSVGVYHKYVVDGKNVRIEYEEVE